MRPAYNLKTTPSLWGSMPTEPNHSRLRQDFTWCALLWLIVVIVDLSGFDFVATRLYGAADGFPWRNHWLTSDVAHRGGRVLSWILFGVTLLAFGFPWRPWPVAKRVPLRTRVWWLACTLLCVALIPVLKHYSLTSCPWDLREFGGNALWISHWAWGVADGGPGRCFPSGHASGAFGFAAGYFALRETAPRHARVWLTIVLVLGVLFGWAQLMRGAHHLSHTLWTAAICWTVTAVTFHATRRWRNGAAA